MLNLLLNVKLNNQFPIEIPSVVNDYSYWHAMATNHIFFNEPFDYLLCHMCVRVDLYPFSKVVDGRQDEFMPIASLQINRYNIQSPHIKRPRLGHIE
jgi:hypothetical protein